MQDIVRHAHLTATEIVQHFRQLRVLVIGDAMLDTYLEGEASRLCSEGPVPVVSKTAVHRLPGGAANTAANLCTLGADVKFLSMVGSDLTGSLLRDVLRTYGLDDRWLVEDERLETFHKLRVCADGQYVVRFDEGGRHKSNQAAQQKLIANLEEAYALCDLVVVSDYCYGLITDELITCLKNLHAASPKIMLIDSKALHRYRDIKATVVTPNDLEARLLVEKMSEKSQQGIGQSGLPGIEDIEPLGWQLLSLLDTELVAITLAERGVFLLDRQGNASFIAAHPVAQAYDVGAGDSFSAAMALALTVTEDTEEAARIGIDAAGIAVTKQRTAVVNYQELLQRVSLREYAMYTMCQTQTNHAAYIRDMHAAVDRLAQLLEAERLLGRKIVFTNGVFDILHAGHIQLLRQAKELGDVLVVGMNSDNSVRRLKGNGRPINSERDRMALVNALDVVDHVVLFDEDTPCELIRKLRPHIHVKGGDYAQETLPEAEVVREVGGSIIILPLVGTMSTSNMIERIVALATENTGETAHYAQGGSYD
ncbi:D-glycero-beta-D-manno-heptose 1-phosphate adenylyltransferase [Ktedonosporobacter rubrisoli]|uniref:D-glycero-beta-D-manno-heptose 1-phosphate adenylyltransferase n=1 Tax=Ktedonosporobacter rubrisoli TaxID=2509675 RepID=A0A4P6JS51_KTERU|nr:D-glycero-beta-D-manno-heptose 1-phosphate adenylyltransferase [Ktedonosporobacter rubrisoli]QBD78337.1 D-glycero-beta-D-manno-heptose 1-phosphate adenylyltransferase [Ktedonosporobacter rubrisoli]